MKELPKQKYLRDIFDYDAATGHLIWLRGKRKGKVAGSICKESGYRSIVIDGQSYRANRLVWCWHHGPIPPGMQTDHKDQNRSNNRIGNLRLATRSQNQWNRGVAKNNTSGHPGVYPVHGAKGTRWGAEIKMHGKMIQLGRHASKMDAIMARQAAVAAYRGEYACL